MLSYFQQKMGEQEMDKEIPHSQVQGLCCFRISDQIRGTIGCGLSWALSLNLFFRSEAANLTFYFEDWKIFRDKWKFIFSKVFENKWPGPSLAVLKVMSSK